MPNFYKFIKKYFVTARFPLRGFAIMLIFFIGIVTTIITYKTSIDVINFFKIENTKLLNRILHISAILIGIATIVQSGPVIWDKLSYWGQACDNFILKFVCKKTNFLIETDASLNFIRNTLNQANKELQNYLWVRALNNYKKDKKLLDDLNQMIDTKISKITKKFEHISRLLDNNEALDNISRQKKADAEFQLNLLVNQLTDLLSKITTLNQQS